MEFQSIEARDDCAVTVLGRLQNQKALQETLVLTTDERLAVEKAEQEFAELEQARALTSGPNAAFDVESDSGKTALNRKMPLKVDDINAL